MKRLRATFLAGAALVAASAPALAQQVNYPVGGYPPGSVVPGTMGMCMNSAGKAVPCPLSDLQPGITKPFRGAQPEQRAGVVTLSPNSPLGYDSGSTPIQKATPNSSSHAAGSSVGGLFSVPVARAAGGGGIITQVLWTSTGGATTQLLVRLWDKKPTNTTCTDQSAFVENATDDQHLISSPFTMTPAAPASTTGDTNTYAAVTGLTISFRNQDNTQNVYACVLTAATDTADESAPVYLNLTGPQD